MLPLKGATGSVPGLKIKILRAMLLKKKKKKKKNLEFLQRDPQIQGNMSRDHLK